MLIKDVTVCGFAPQEYSVSDSVSRSHSVRVQDFDSLSEYRLRPADSVIEWQDLSFNLKPGTGDTRLIPETPAKRGKLTAHLDYLRISVTLPDLSRLQEMCQFIFWENYQLSVGGGWSPGKGAVRYENGLVGDFGGRGGWRFVLAREDGTDVELQDGYPVGDNVPVQAMIDLPGEFWESLDSIGMWRLLRGLKCAYDVRACRVDAAIDDYGFEFIPLAEMIAETENGNNMFFCIYKQIKEMNTRTKKKTLTDYFGSRQSGKLVRCYPHVFGDGVSKALRMEAEFKRGYAVKVFESIASIERHTEDDKEFDIVLQKVIAAHATGAIDFRDKSVRENRGKASVKDCPRLDFWSKFLSEVGGAIRVKLDRVIKTVEKTIDWLYRSVAPTVSAFYQALPSLDRLEFVSNLVAKGNDRGGDLHKLIKKIGKNEPDRMKLALCR